MSALTILSVIGTRPEAIKMAPVLKALAQHPNEIRSIVCTTAQHRRMLDQVLCLFDIHPDHDLDIMQPDQDLSSLTARLLTSLTPIMQETKPDWVLAQGDTTSVMTAALAAFYHRVPFGHVEAGLRTGDLADPFPEEFNRRVADRTAALLFAPTELNRQTLIREGVAEDKIHVTGNTIVDALVDIAAQSYDWSRGPLSELPRSENFVLITAHRRESFGEPLRQICFAVRDLALRYASRSVHFVYPVHLNPNVRGPVAELLSGIPNLSLIEPLDYLSFVHLMKRCILVLTDSGGIQEEAPSLGVPVLVMRRVTERPEGVEAGVVRLVGTEREQIVCQASRLIESAEARAEMSTARNPFGDGRAAGRIVAALLGVNDLVESYARG